MNGQDKTDLELLRLEMRSEFKLVNQKLEVLKDHETRIRSVERWKYSVPIGVLLGLAGLVGAAIGGR